MDGHCLPRVSQCRAFYSFKKQEASIVVNPVMDHPRNRHLWQGLLDELNRFALQQHICCPGLHFAECIVSDDPDCWLGSFFVYQGECIGLWRKSVVWLLRSYETQDKPWVSIFPRRYTWFSWLAVCQSIAFDGETEEPKRTRKQELWWTLEEA